MAGTKWKSLSINEDIIAVVQSKFGFDKITEVQKRCIPHFLAHKDVIVQAPTGSGKTLAFVIPLLQILLKRGEPLKKWQIGALILVPNRELALQIAKTIEPFLEHSSAKFQLITFIGGTKVTTDIENFKKNGGNIVVATPGRLCDLLNQDNDTNFNLAGHLKTLEVLILDEADRLMELGFHDSLREILTRLPKQRRTGLFSATQTDSLDELAKTGLRNPMVITVYDNPFPTSTGNATSNCDGMEKGSITPMGLKNYYAIISPPAKFTALQCFLRQNWDRKVLVFLSTCACVDYFGELLKRLFAKRKGGKSSSTDMDKHILTLHGKKKKKRRQIFEQFSQLETGVLVCTDVMARGIDIENIDWVVQFDPPRHASWFIHRCGRTARCGRSGNALLILTPSEEGYVEFLERNQGVSLDSLEMAHEEGREWAMLDRIRKIVSRRRELLEKGSRAFVSFIQAYLKHDCRIVCNLKELDVINVAHCFGLFRLPKMRELAGRDLSGFRRCEIDTGNIPYEDKKREKLRINRFDGKMKDNSCSSSNVKRDEEETMMNEDEANVDDEIVDSESMVNKRKKRRKEVDELEELDEDYKVVKRLKKGKVTKDKFDEHFMT